MDQGSTLIDRSVLGVDVEGYSGRNVRRQRDAQHELGQILDRAARTAGVDRSRWEVSHTGDGELAVLPADVNLLALVGRFVPVLHDLLVLHNEDRTPGSRLRLRLAIHIDAVTPSTPGHYAGPALVTLARLLDCGPVRRALAQADGADLALILSDPVHTKVVRSGLLAVRERDYARIEVDLPAKDFHQPAWVHVPGHDMGTFPALAEQTSTEPAPTEAPATTAEQTRPTPAATNAPSISAGHTVVIGGNVDQRIVGPPP
jgi:hypothetical protein